MAATLSIPAFFRCPISLEIMKDPVTLCTGVTYDRESIERWFEEGRSSCPATMQALDTLELTPNHTLRRLIQGWCVSNRGRGIERIDSPPKLPAHAKRVERMLMDIRNAPTSMGILAELADLARENEKNRRCIAASGGISVLTAALLVCRSTMNDSEIILAAGEEILAILAILPIHDSNEEERTGSLTNSKAMDTVCWFLSRGSFRGRLHAAQVLHGILTADQNLQRSFRPDEEIFENIALLLRDVCPLATKTALEILLIICPVRRNRIKAAEAGVAVTLIELLPEAERNMAEKALALLEILCQSAEGRASVCGHPLGIPVLVRKIARVSELATQAATGALWQICKCCPTASVLQDLDDAGSSPKLFLLLQIGCSSSTRQKAREILRIHKGRAWMDNPCIFTDQPNDSKLRDIHAAKLTGNGRIKALLS